MRKLSKLIILSFYFYTSIYTFNAWAAPGIDDVEIISIQANGTGCPVGSSTELIVDTLGDGTADFFQVTFSEFFVEKPGFSIKNCLVEVLLRIPQGFQYTIGNIAYEGFAVLGSQVTGSLTTKYEFPFFTNSVTTNKVLPPNFVGPFEKNDTLGIFSSIYSPCGRTVPMNMNSRLVLIGPDHGYSFMGVDRQSGLLTQVWAIQWRECDSKNLESISAINVE